MGRKETWANSSMKSILLLQKSNKQPFFQEICWIRWLYMSATVFNIQSRDTVPGVKRQTGKMANQQQANKNVIREIAWHLSKCIMGNFFMSFRYDWIESNLKSLNGKKEASVSLCSKKRRPFHDVRYRIRWKKYDCFMVTNKLKF